MCQGGVGASQPLRDTIEASWTVEHTPQGSLIVQTDGQPANVLTLAAIKWVMKGEHE
jgi:hypothetical protein